MKSIIIGAGSDLGVHIDGAHLGPAKLIDEIKDTCNEEILSYVQDEHFVKSKDINDKAKNLNEVNNFNKMLYSKIKEKMRNNIFPITLGGDHSVAIASSLADCAVNKDIGIIWFDAHTDYNTFDTTVSGNIHGLPLAAINGIDCDKLTAFHNGFMINPKNTVIVGARSIDPLELEVLKKTDVTIFTTNDIKKYGVRYICDKAFDIACNNTKSVHISFDLDLIDPSYAPGVSTAEDNGISKEDAISINNIILERIDKISSYDLVEYNPLNDKNNKTKKIALKILNDILQKIKEK